MGEHDKYGQSRSALDETLTPAPLNAELPLCKVSMAADGACFDGMSTHEIYARRMQYLLANALMGALERRNWDAAIAAHFGEDAFKAQFSDVVSDVIRNALIGERGLLLPAAAVEYFLAYLAMEQSRCERVTLSKRYEQPFDGLEAHLKRWDARREVFGQLRDNLLRKLTQESM